MNQNLGMLEDFQPAQLAVQDPLLIKTPEKNSPKLKHLQSDLQRESNEWLRIGKRRVDQADQFQCDNIQMFKPDPDSAAAHRPSQRFNRNKDFVTQDHEYYVRQKEFKNKLFKRLSNLKDRFQRQEEQLSYLNSLDSTQQSMLAIS